LLRSSLTALLPSAVLVAALAGCTSGQSARQPLSTSVGLNSNTLGFAVGVATYTDGTTGLNTVATYRQPNGLSGTLVNSPTIFGPPGFVVPTVKSARTDAGTSHISSSPQTPAGSPPPPATTFNQSGGVFAYGFAPENVSTAGAPNFRLYPSPFYGDPSQTSTFFDFTASGALNVYPFEGGPPAYPQVRNGTFPPGFIGYTQGFTAFSATPVAGTYVLHVTVATANAPSASAQATATLASTTGLPAITTAPVFTEDGAGGGTVTIVTAPGATETMVDIFDDSVGTYYSLLLPGGGGTQSATLPDNLGPQSTATPMSASIPTGDVYEVTAFSVDYPLFEAGPPQNTQAAPVISGANGQADISFSPIITATYGTPGSAAVGNGTYARMRRPR